MESGGWVPLRDATVTYRGTSDDAGAPWVAERRAPGSGAAPAVPVRPQTFRPLSELFFAVGVDVDVERGKAATAGDSVMPTAKSAREEEQRGDQGPGAGKAAVPLSIPQRLVPCTPRNVIEEIESYYCPQCLENFPSSEAMSFRGRCPRGECFTCAVCGAPALPRQDGDTGNFYFCCGACRWNSVGCGLVGDSEPTSWPSLCLRSKALRCSACGTSPKSCRLRCSNWKSGAI